MRAYYNILNILREILIGEESINEVTKGSLDDVDLNKKTMYGLGHILINSFVPVNGIVRFNVSVIVMDIVDQTKAATDKMDETAFRGIDNESDVLNTMSAVIMRVIEQLRRGDYNADGYALNSVTSIEPFTERFEDNVAGWVGTFNVDVAHNMEVC